MISMGTYLLLEDILGEGIPIDLDGYDSFIDWVIFRKNNLLGDKPRIFLPFQSLVNIVYIVGYCTVDVSTCSEHFRQTFYKGKAVSPCERRSMDQRPLAAPFLSLQFTLDSSIIESSTVTYEEVQQAIERLQHGGMVEKNLQLISYALRDYGFEMTIGANEVI
ncbi:MAG: hypothetical protein R3E31_06460 [Chloroflexota bacterium]